MSNGELTVELAQRAMPQKMKLRLTQEIIDTVNNAFSDQTQAEVYRDNVLGYSSVMREGKFTIQQYLAGVKYIGFKMIGDNNIVAYTKTHPDRMHKMQEQGKEEKHIAAIISTYNSSKLITILYEQSLIPTYLLNQDKYQQAINVQTELMLTAKSETVRTNAADSIMTQLKPPETVKIEMELGMKADPAIHALHETTMKLVAQQKLMLQSGASDAKEVAGITIDMEPPEIINE